MLLGSEDIAAAKLSETEEGSEEMDSVTMSSGGVLEGGGVVAGGGGVGGGGAGVGVDFEENPQKFRRVLGVNGDVFRRGITLGARPYVLVSV